MKIEDILNLGQVWLIDKNKPIGPFRVIGMDHVYVQVDGFDKGIRSTACYASEKDALNDIKSSLKANIRSHKLQIAVIKKRLDELK
jgi:hypothetical protein